MAALLIMVMGNSLFAHEKGDIFISPEVQIGLEIPNIHQKNEYPKGTYVSLGVDWGGRITAGYYFLNWFAAGAGIGFGGFHDTNNYNEKNTAFYAETYTYDAGYLIIPGGFRVNRGRLAAGAGLAGYIPLFFDSSGESRARQTNTTGNPTTLIVNTGLANDNFSIHSFLGGYIDIGYDWAGSKDQNQGFGFYVRGQFPFDDTIAEGKLGFKNFQHASVSVILSYCFKIANTPPAW
jgi:hypothetical protein